MPDETTLDEIEKIEEESYYSDDSVTVPPSDIIAFNELRSCYDLVRMYQNGQLDIQPDFQREVVWSGASQTRFIDSLIKQLPIPSICISLDYKTDKRIVIDGLQRMQSIIKFLSDDSWKMSTLNDIDKKISGKTVSSIKTKTPDLYSRVENSIIPVTIIRCDFNKKDHLNYLFTIFHRLNTGGIRLNNQEIRNCIYSGKLNRLLTELSKYDNFMSLYGLEEDKSYRFNYEELILRFFALYDKLDSYHGKLSLFLNEYMNKNKNPNDSFINDKTRIFKKTTDILFMKILDRNMITHTSKTTIEAVFYGIAKNITYLEEIDDIQIKEYYQCLLDDSNFTLENLKDNPSNVDKVKIRLEKAKEIFSGQ